MTPIDRHFPFPNQALSLVGEDKRVTSPWLKFFLSLYNRTGGGQGNVTSGFIGTWAGPTVPNGYLLCDGRQVSRQTYGALFNAIGTLWGPGDGATTFNLPNLVDKFLRGGASAGVTGGSNAITLGVNQLPSHTHIIDDPGHAHNVTDPTHVHTITDPGHVHTALVASSTNTAGAAAGTSVAGNTGSATTGITVDPAATGVTVDSNTTGVTAEATGGGQPIDITPAYVTLMVVIKT